MGTETLWRVLFTSDTRLKLPASAAGPWHDKRAIAEQWVTWFRLHTGFARIQSSRGEVWEGSTMIRGPQPVKR